MVEFGKFVLSNYANDFVVTDDKIASLYGINGDNVFLLPRGESAKNFACAEQLCRWLLAKKVKKNSQLVAVGGGSIGDVVGFVASIFKRGVKLLHIPTTLLAMVDSSIGGKTAMDLDGAKNVVGTFYPANTLVDTTFLQTLDNEQLTNGMGEILKYRMLDSNIATVFESQNLSALIQKCITYKLDICNADPYDNGLRQKLNFGHTLGHAMELSLDIPHGLSVISGIYYETLLAHNLGLCDKNYLQKWQGECQKLANICPCLTDSMLDLCLNDKKNDTNQIAFVLPTTFQRVTLPLQQVKQLLL